MQLVFLCQEIEEYFQMSSHTNKQCKLESGYKLLPRHDEGLHISTSLTIAGEGQLPEVREAGAVPRPQQPGGVPRLVPGWGKDDNDESDNDDNEIIVR